MTRENRWTDSDETRRLTAEPSINSLVVRITEAAVMCLDADDDNEPRLAAFERGIVQDIDRFRTEALTTAQAEIEALKLDLATQEALWDSAYHAGMKAGWNFCDSRDHEGYLRAQEGTEHIAELKRIRAARATLAGKQP